MGSEPEPNQSSPKSPKLSLLSLPQPPRQTPPGIPTPPLQTMASVPFLWEEAPGKPRPSAVGTPPAKPKAARCLELPPRLLNEGRVTNTPSPTTVLDGPYSSRGGGGGRSDLSHTMSFSFAKEASCRSPEGRKQIGKERWNFSSWRWVSFKEEDDGGGGDAEGSFDFSPSIAGIFSESDVSRAKITRTKKRKSFFGSSKSHIWASIYESVKQAVPWRRKQGK